MQSASSKVELPHVGWKAILHKSNQVQHSSAEGILSLLGSWQQRNVSGALAADHKAR
jgi:hypothetical protein